MSRSSNNRVYIGLATTHHDPALAIVGADGKVLFAEAAERFLQHKRALNCPPDPWTRMPGLLREYCDPNAAIVIATSWSRRHMFILNALGAIGFSAFDRSRRAGAEINRLFLREFHERAFCSFLNRAQQTAGMALLAGVFQAFGHLNVSIRRYSHHLVHAANACLTSSFSEAACAVVDGIGEGGFATFFAYREGRLRLIKQFLGRQSLGFLYGLITEMCGFDANKGEEWKVMGLAPYGTFDEEIYELFRRMYQVSDRGVTFSRTASIRETIAALRRYGRTADSNPLDAANLACVGQYVFSEIMTALLRQLEKYKLSNNLALAGGCALNSSYNGAALNHTSFEKLYVPSAPGDDGNAIGAALLAYSEDHPEHQWGGSFQSPYLGSGMEPASLGRYLQYHGSAHVQERPETICQEAAKRLASGKLVGWIQGRAEFGPRALGNRSILADPRNRGIKDIINASVKFRESFRPFAPSILHEFGDDYFENYQESPYMERTLRFRNTAACHIPGVAHVDQTGRVQTVKKEWNARFHQLLQSFYEVSGVPVVLNTSFNIMGRPIAHSLEDAISLFHTSGLDTLVLGDYLIDK